MAKQNSKSTTRTGFFATLSPGARDVLCVALLYAISLVLFSGIVFEGKVFSSGGDTANHLSYKHAGEQIEAAEGEDAIWTPYVFGGMPTFGNVSYIPANVSYVEAAAMTALKLFFLNGRMSWLVAFYFLGGVFMFFLMRAWRFERPAALIAAITFMLSPYAIGLAEVGHGSKVKALSYLPLMVLLTHYLFEKRSLLSFGLLSAGIGTLMLTNHVQIVYYVLITMGFYLVYHLILGWKKEPAPSARKILLFAGAFAVGLAISSYIYLSVYEYSQFSIRGGGTAGSTGGLTWDYATSWSMHPLELLTLLMPSFFGFTSPYYWGWMPFTSSTVYAGIIPLFLAAVAVALRRERLVWFCIALTVIALLMSFGKHIPVLYQLMFDYLPFFNKFRAPSTILHLLPFTFGVMAAYGFTALVEAGPNRKKSEKLMRVLLYILGAVGALLVLSFLLKSTIFESLASFMFVREGELAQYSRQYGAQAPQIIEQLKQIRFYGNEQTPGFWADYVRFLIFLLGAVGALYFFLRNSLKPGQFAAALIALLVIDLGIVDARFIHPVPSRSLDDNFRPDPTEAFLLEQPGLFRVFPLGGEHYGDNSYAYHGIQSLGGYSAAKLKMYQTMIDSCMYVPVEPGIPVNTNILNMLNARYLVSSFPLPPQRFPQVFGDGERRKLVSRNDSALPRVFFVDSILTAGSDSEVFRLLNSPGFDPSRTAILYSTPVMPTVRPDSTTATIEEYRSREIRVRAYTSAPSLLVLSEMYYPAGWTATIDGGDTEIYRTNYLLRSVVVPPGEHSIVFRFDPPTYSAGWTATHVAWLLAAVCIVGGIAVSPDIRRRFRPGAKRETA